MDDRPESLTDADLRSLRRIITAHKKDVPPDNLMILIRSSAQTHFKDVITILDEMQIAMVPAGHYMEQPMHPKEEALFQ